MRNSRPRFGLPLRISDSAVRARMTFASYPLRGVKTVPSHCIAGARHLQSGFFRPEHARAETRQRHLHYWWLELCSTAFPPSQPPEQRIVTFIRCGWFDMQANFTAPVSNLGMAPQVRGHPVDVTGQGLSSAWCHPKVRADKGLAGVL
ncbi:hypothetical protein MKX08_004886 [Trichoderma sp. CBMAI-0020]|nr:hypothetical protein MKX08_004886 [Trichoderma sp. CBMAI-0020]